MKSRPQPIVLLQNVSIKQGSHVVLHDLTWQINPGEQWTVVGPVGAGKSQLLRAIQKQCGQPVAAVRFEDLREGGFNYGRFFYQQRFHASMNDEAETVMTRLFGETRPDKLRDATSPTGWAADHVVPPDERALALIDRLALTDLLHQPLPTLSNGQTRKMLILQALLRQPRLLLLDDPLVGLDTRFRAELTAWINELIGQGTQIVLVAQPDALPEGITHVLHLRHGRIIYQGQRSDYSLAPAAPCPPPAAQRTLPPLQTPAILPDFTTAFSLTDVSVRYGENVLLDRVSWTVRAGERWALLGPNGAGKSLILSLLYGDHPQAYANNVRLFDKRRGSGESIWQVKKRIGFVSPELHLYFPRHETVRNVVLTGLTDSLLVPKRISPEHEHDLYALLRYVGLGDLTNRPFGTLSAGQQRLALLIRALLKRSPCLLLDEPFQHLDADSRERVQDLLANLPGSTTLLFITHYVQEIPSSVQHVAHIERGRLTVQEAIR